VDVGLAAGPEPLLRTGALHARGHGVGEPRVAVGGEFRQQFVTVGEVMARCGVRDVQCTRQPSERDGIGSLTLQHLARFFDECLPEVAVVVAGLCRGATWHLDSG
jgi:hypothetical protein